MKTCAYCGRENEDQAIRCQECGAELARVPASTEHTPNEPDETGRFEKAVVLDNEVQAELVDSVLSERDIPHLMRSYHDSAYDGLFQFSAGWGRVEAPLQRRDEILEILDTIRRESDQQNAEPAEG